MEWPWRPPRLLDQVSRALAQDHADLHVALSWPRAGAERWQDNRRPRQLVLGCMDEVPSPLLAKANLRVVEAALGKVRTGRWEVTVCLVDQVVAYKGNTVSTPLGNVMLFPYGMFVGRLAGPVGDLRLKWANEVAAGMAIEEYVGGPDGSAELWLSEGIFPLRLIERWPDPAWIDCTVLSPTIIPFVRDVYKNEPETAEFVTGPLERLKYMLEKELGVPCELRLVNMLPAAIEDLTGKLLGKDPQLEVMEDLKNRAARCENPIEQKFFWEALKYKVHLTPQYEIGRYRVDFALESFKIAIEIDGYEYHSSQQQIERDYERENFLKGQGWEVVRFTAGQVSRDAGDCIRKLKMIMLANPQR